MCGDGVVLVLHADRDGECIAIYAKEDLDIAHQVESLESITAGREYLISCFVPTMMLRWKRALFEACDVLEPECPPALRALVPIEEDSTEPDFEETSGEEDSEGADDPDSEEGSSEA